MAKYSPEFKLKVTLEAVQDHLSVAVLSHLYGIDKSATRYWLQRYQCHGSQAFTREYSTYSAEYKLQVLTYMKQNQLSLREMAAYFDIRGGADVVSQWERLYDGGGLAALEPRPKGRPPIMKKLPLMPTKSSLPTNDEELTQLRKENEYLRAENAYLKKLDALLQQKAGHLPKKKRV